MYNIQTIMYNIQTIMWRESRDIHAFCKIIKPGNIILNSQHKWYVSDYVC